MLKSILKFTAILVLFVSAQQAKALSHPEQRLLWALEAIQATDLIRAEKILSQLINDEPEFKSAHLLYADVLKAKTQPLNKVGLGLSKTEDLSQLLREVKSRWQAKQVNQQAKDKIPVALSYLDENYLHALVVDLDKSRLFVFDNFNGRPKQVADYYISMGRGGARKEKEGDLRTPTGVYFVQDYIPPYRLADKYGAGAYPINYPNAWDLKNGRTGSGIWLHGTRSGTYNRPPLASEGCVVLPNDDLIEVGSYISLGQTPVLIGNNLKWVDVDQWKQQQSGVMSLFEQWINDWQSLNTESYLSHYSKEFSNGKKDYNHWVQHKRRVSKYKKQILVDATDVSLLKHPNEDVMVATFHQNYKSDNYVSQSWKRQYWKKEQDGQWRIIYEGEISAPTNTQLVKNSL